MSAIELDTMYSGPAFVRVLAHDSGKLALFIEFLDGEEGGVTANPEEPDAPKESGIILPHPVHAPEEEYAPAAVSDEEAQALLTV